VQGSEPIERKIDDHTIEPRGEPGDPRIERRGAAPNSQERVLADIIGLGRAADDALGNANGETHVPSHEDAKSTLIALGDETHEALVGLVPGHALL